MQMAIRLMLKANTKGSIINMASTAGHRASPMASIYSSSKFCLIGMNQNVAMEYATHGIRCNSISPVGRIQPDQVSCQAEYFVPGCHAAAKYPRLFRRGAQNQFTVPYDR